MRSALLLSVVSVALLGLLGWVRHESRRPDQADLARGSIEGGTTGADPAEDEHVLFVG